MIDLYAMGSPNVVKIYIALEEMRLPYTGHPVDVFGEAQFDPQFLRTKTTRFDKAGAEAMDRLFGRGKHAAAA